MKKLILKVDSLFRRLVSLERILGAILLLVMLVICFAAVIMRYVFVKPIVWSEEVILVLLVIFGYICISIDVYRDAHVALTVLYNRVPRKVQYVLDLIRHLLIGAFFALMVNAGWKIYLIKYRKIMAASGWSQGIVFMAQVVAAVLCVLFCAMNLVKTLAHLQVGDRPEGEEEPSRG
ncbi:MAG: TRAP transporter small permease [Candidatus Ventricola sp.]